MNLAPLVCLSRVTPLFIKCFHVGVCTHWSVLFVVGLVISFKVDYIQFFFYFGRDVFLMSAEGHSRNLIVEYNTL